MLGTGPRTRQERNAALLERLQAVHGLADGQTQAVRDIFARSPYIGQGNPAVTVHPATPAACEAKLAGLGVRYENARFQRICGSPYMAPLYDPRTETPEDSRVCIDQFEFPDIPCEYPVVWVRAGEAAGICEAIGKRLCDAHEWEGACAGRIEEPDYFFALAEGVAPATAVARMQRAHNQKYAGQKVWSYGPEYRTGVCATSSRKSPECDGGSYARCGSNTFPTGMYPECRSQSGVYDINGNAAEHMNLPLNPAQLASRGSTELGYTEMKGSWFVFDAVKAHEDACRWRAPYWHGSRVLDPDSHRNYHLGFRCCKSLPGDGP
ncbi:MAG: hypothetical protein ABIG68_15015, partial [Acidobacteriota bacterium]